MPAPISSQKTIGVASAPTTRLGWRMNRTSSRRARDIAGSSSPGALPVTRASGPCMRSEHGLGARVTKLSLVLLTCISGNRIGFELDIDRIMIARRPGEPVGEHFYFLDLIFHLFG